MKYFDILLYMCGTLESDNVTDQVVTQPSHLDHIRKLGPPLAVNGVKIET